MQQPPLTKSGTNLRTCKQAENPKYKVRRKGNAVHFPTLVEFCHLEHSELEKQFQKYKGRAVLHGDVVKDDPG